MKARARTALLLGVVVAFAASLTMGSTAASAATPSLHRNYVNPQASPAGSPVQNSATGNYGLFGCQVGLDAATCYDPYEMRHAYGVDSLISHGYDGTGKTIVILDAFYDPYLQSDFSYFNNFYGLPDQTITQVYPDGVPPYDAGWSEEMQLDVDWSHAIAPGAKIVIVHALSNSDEDLLSAFNYAVDHNLGDMISMSFGESDKCLGSALQAGWHQGFVNATKKGITLFASSGDQGAAQPSCDGNSWIQSSSSPASDPLVTGVGGTELHAADLLPHVPGLRSDRQSCARHLAERDRLERGRRQPGLGTSSGGGYSTVWSEPAYQQGTIHGGKTRAVPDVAYNAAIFHGVLVPLLEFGGFFLFGGTSCGSPQWAGLTAIADQMHGSDYGFINPPCTRSVRAASPTRPPSTTSRAGHNNSLQFDSSNNPVNITGFNAGTGWDAVTGLGTPASAGGLFSQMGQVWSAGQGNAAISNSKNG